MKTTIFNRITAAFLAFIMVLAMVPASLITALADTLEGLGAKNEEKNEEKKEVVELITLRANQKPR